MKQRIAVLTGTRAEYGYIKRILELMKKSTKLQYFLIVSGMHFLKEHGLTVEEIKKDGFVISATVDIKADPENPADWAKSVGNSVIKMSDAFEKIKPDLILLPGDPWMTFAAAVAATYMRIPIGHIQGGEISGNVDGVVRHAITKLSHLHFVANKLAEEVVKKLGEEDFRIFNVGGPMLDEVVNGVKIDSKILANELGYDFSKPLIIVLQHPVSIEYELAGKQMENTLNAIDDLKQQTVIIYPNSEPGSKDMINIIDKYKNRRYIKIFKSLPRIKYLSLLNNASVLVGNSSSGIIEAPALRIPVVNVGNRQNDRVRAENVIDVNYDENEILNSIKKALFDKSFRNKVMNCSSPYGDGKSSEGIVEILENTDLKKIPLQKKITY